MSEATFMGNPLSGYTTFGLHRKNGQNRFAATNIVIVIPVVSQLKHTIVRFEMLKLILIH